jgi:hypothetical protein
MYLMRMDNGIHTFYEGNSTATGILNCWHEEYYRAEFEQGTVEVSHGSEMRIHRAGQDVEIYEAPAIKLNGHAYLFAEFLDWMDGEKPSVTRIENNIKSFAMVMAAVGTTADGQPKRIADYFMDLDL